MAKTIYIITDLSFKFSAIKLPTDNIARNIISSKTFFLRTLSYLTEEVNNVLITQLIDEINLILPITKSSDGWTSVTPKTAAIPKLGGDWSIYIYAHDYDPQLIKAEIEKKIISGIKYHFILNLNKFDSYAEELWRYYYADMNKNFVEGLHILSGHDWYIMPTPDEDVISEFIQKGFTWYTNIVSRYTNIVSRYTDYIAADRSLNITINYVSRRFNKQASSRKYIFDNANLLYCSGLEPSDSAALRENPNKSNYEKFIIRNIFGEEKDNIFSTSVPDVIAKIVAQTKEYNTWYAAYNYAYIKFYSPANTTKLKPTPTPTPTPKRTSHRK